MRQFKVIFWYLFIALSLTFTACSTTPVYKTTYNYLSPLSADSKSCTHQCEVLKIQCEQIQDLKAEREKDRCEQKNKGDSWFSSLFSQDCDDISPEYEKCENNYRRCFERCGGKVIEKAE
jgi:hypothetical protein